MTKPFQTVFTPDAPFGTSPFSQLTIAGGFLFPTAQSPIDPKTNAKIGADVGEQTRVAIENLSTILQAAGHGLESVFKTTVYLTTLTNLPEMNAVYGTMFTEPYPSRTVLVVAQLPFDALVYIEAIALCSSAQPE